MTRFSGAPYLSLAIRPVLPVILALCGCATDVVTHAELGELMGSIRALRAETARLENRLARLEAQGVDSKKTQGAVASEQVRATPARREAPVPPDEVPPLTVVKLSPRPAARAPSLATEVEVQEPGADPHVYTNLDVEPVDPAEGDLSFEKGVAALKQGRVDDGVAQLTRFVEGWPRHPRADNALHLSGVALLSGGEPLRARELFQRVLDSYPAGDAVIDAMLRLGDCQLRLKQTEKARATWQALRDTYPGTPAAHDAGVRLSSL